uniref:histone acetyltransferase n=1 Tax=Hyaloperonospora arabidopsidis (strain Emoy2) TaxID=559515 RepID=M4BUB4_HYAAE
MSAPIDDLLYGGDDDSGDDDDMNTSLPLLRSYAGVPLAGAAVTPPGGLLLAPATSAPSVLKPLPLMTPATTGGPPQALALPSMSTGVAVTSAAKAPSIAPAAPVTPVKLAPGSGQQMFQQMFALLKQMLPVEQYATLHSEMRKGNANDIKSIVEIIKRIVGDATFSSVIQKMDLTRTLPVAGTATSAAATTPSTLGAMKSEPGAATALTSPGVLGGQLADRTMGLSALPVTSTIAASPKPTAIAPNTRPIAAASPLVVAAMPTSIAARPTQVQQSPGTVNTPPAKGLNDGMKPEPAVTAATAFTSSSSNTPLGAGQSRNEALEKILFAKRLLSHAATCSLSHGVCQVKKCDDVRRVFKHSLSCGGANGCSHCEQLKGLVKYHAKECAVGIVEHCSIPFCDGLRRTYAQSQAAAVAKLKVAQAGGMVESDDDDDNTPLSSAVSKAKKQAKAKSPKNMPARGVVAQPLKRKGSITSLTRTNSSTSPGPSVVATPPNATTTAAASSAVPASAGAKPPQKNVTANMTQEYGRLLQLILHVEKCTTSACAVGEECAESKTIMKQMASPNPPVRAKTYKQVYGHYKTCVAKNNTANCPMCKIGLLPILPTPSPALSPHAQTSFKTLITPSASAVACSTVATFPLSADSNKRGNSAVSPTPRSPIKKQRTNSTSRMKTTAVEVAAQIASASDLVNQELAQASVMDIRSEADVLTHTDVELGTERRIMMEGGPRRVRMEEQLPCRKEDWVEKDLFNSEKLRGQMREAARRSGVELGSQTSEVMAYALHEYLKQVMEEMVEIAKQRGDSQAQSFEALQNARRVGAAMDGRWGNRMELSATDILRVSCEDSFTKLAQEDLMLRSQLLEDARREEQIEKERAKKRKKVDRSKLNQDERDEAEMDIEELAVKDLKERLLQQDKEGVVRVTGRVNESISVKYASRMPDNQVTMEDANYWLLSQKPYIRPKLFLRAEAARIVTKSLL